jgi:SPP1 gp7 family putative phage head morphogenesis protein
MPLITFSLPKATNSNIVKRENSDKYIFITDDSLKVTEQFKGKVEVVPEQWMKELGEKHPFNFNELGKIVKQIGYISAIVDKYVDYIVGGGIRAVCENERAQTIINDWLRDVSFEVVLRSWIREGLVKGNGFLELGKNEDGNIVEIKLLNADNMFVIRDEYGNVLGYKQYWGANLQNMINNGRYIGSEVIDFKPSEIAHLAINRHADMVYGFGLLYPTLSVIDNMVQADKDMHMLIRRKANSPIVAKMGSLEHNDIPNTSDMSAFKSKLEALRNNQEFVTGPNIEMKVLDFGNIGNKFDFILTFDRDKIHSVFQVPAVLMGLGSIPEGLAQVQMEAFMMNIKSKQDEIEKIIEEKIFRVILNSNGLDNHVEVEWGQPNERELREEILMHSNLISNPNFGELFRKKLEMKIAKRLGFSEEEILEMEESRELEMQQVQPIVPGQNNPTKEEWITKDGRHIYIDDKGNPHYGKDAIDKANEDKKGKGGSGDSKSLSGRTTSISKSHNVDEKTLMENGLTNEFDIQTDYPLNEWLGFNYQKYLKHINSAIEKDKFTNLKAETNNEKLAGYLTERQISRLKNIFKDSFERGENLNQISDRLIKEGKIKDLYKLNENGDIVLNEENDPEIRLGREQRAKVIARTETTRLAGEGQQLYYEDSGVEKYRWVSTLGMRTCQICEELNGQIFVVGDGPIPGEPHLMCRCTTVAVSK